MKSTKYLPSLLLFLSVCIYIIGFLFSYDYLIGDLYSAQNRVSAIRSIVEYSVMYTSFILFCSFIYKSKYLKFLSYIMLVGISINSFISYCCYLVYGTGFNIGMAVSVLDSNIAEATNMIYDYLLPLFISLSLLLINSIIVIKFSKIKLPKKFSFIYFLWFILPVIFLLKHHYIGYKGGGPMVKNVMYHFKDFKSAYQLNQNMSKIKEHKVVYTYQKVNQGIETVVLVIGESVRKQNMSLYGYDRKTSPHQDALKNNMILFTEAHSPAAITNLSIPLMLSPLTPEEYNTKIEKVSDNVVNLANSQGYTTTWLTTQNNIKGVTEIASYSNNKKWVNGYDTELLPYINETLNQKGKKFVVIHINGSHPNPCLRYPDNFNHFDSGNTFDCYDNSILYTDQFLGEVFKKLTNKNAALIYLSDHGLKSVDNKLIHTDSKESTQVPFYTWFSNTELKDKYAFDKDRNQSISISYLYPMVMKLFGLDEIKLDKIENDNYIKLDHKIIPYKELE